MVDEPKLGGGGDRDIRERRERCPEGPRGPLPGVPFTLHTEGLTPWGIPSLQMTLTTCRASRHSAGDDASDTPPATHLLLSQNSELHGLRDGGRCFPACGQ